MLIQLDEAQEVAVAAEPPDPLQFGAQGAEEEHVLCGIKVRRAWVCKAFGSAHALFLMLRACCCYKTQ